MEISLDVCAGIPVVRVTGDMRLWDKPGLCGQLRGTVVSLITEERKQIILNLSEASHIDSRGLGCLARCYATAVALGAEVTVVIVPGLVLEALTRFKLLSMFKVSSNDTEAAASFSASAADA